MIEISKKQQKIIGVISKEKAVHSSAIRAELVKAGENVSLVTVKRTLSEMVAQGILIVSGSGRATNYDITTLGRVFADIDAKQYCAVEPDKRYGSNGFNFHFFSDIPSDVFTDDELAIVHNATVEYERRTADLSSSIQKKELERLIIELSWKSSKIEGNTYTLLDTEKLILDNIEAPGRSKKETAMILNHKDAFNYIHENSERFKIFNRMNIEEVHRLLVKDLGVGFGLRQKPVGIIGSKYQPLDTIFQITEAMEAFVAAISRMSTPYAKALITLVGISYIQPFEDGNKRTARLMANAILLAHHLAPLSYRSVDENEYREAMLVFYELNSIIPIKNIFVRQYDFAARNYAVK